MRPHSGKEGRQGSCWRASELNLTPEQKKGLEEIQQSHFREAQLLRAQLFTKQLEFREFLTDRSMKAESIRSKYSEIIEIQSRFEEKAVEYLIKVRNILTEEQLSAWCPEQEFPVFRRMMMEPMHRRRSPMPPGSFKEE